MAVDTPYNPVVEPDGIEVNHFIKFNPSMEYGFRTQNQLLIERTNDFQNLSYMSAADASTMFHNFYGLRVTMKADQRYNDGKLRMPSTMNYQTMAKPESRYHGGQVNQVAFQPTSRDTYLGADANLYSMTNQMYRFYSQPNGAGNFLGFGIFLFKGEIRATTSRYGGFIKHYLQIATWELKKEFIPGNEVKVYNPNYPAAGEDEFISVYYLDGSYQKYLKSLEWADPRLVPDINGSYRTYSITLNDYRGNRIPFKVTEAVMEKVDKYINYKYDEETQKSIIDTVDDLRGAKTTFNIGEGMFYKYGGSATELQPNNYGL